MDRFLVKTELGKTERKKPKPRRAVVLSDDDDDGAVKAPTRNDIFMDQLAAFIARENGLVKLSDDGNEAKYGKPTGDDVYISEKGDAFVKVEDQVARAPAPPPGGKRCRLEPRQQKPNPKKPNPFDEYCLPDDALASIPLP